MGRTRVQRRNIDPFWDLVATARRLQAPGGCPWDRAQTVRSLMPHLVEETWEVFCAHRRPAQAAFEEELGDVLYTVLFLALIAERRGWLRLDAMLTRTRAKMIRRHPHVFAAEQAKTAQDAYRHWQAAKTRERAASGVISSSKRLRPLLVAMWEELLELETSRATGRRPRRTSARPARGSTR